MGDVRFARYYATLQNAADPAAMLQSLPDEGVIAALAAASREKEPYLANVLATEAMNRALRWETLYTSLGEGVVIIGPGGRVVDLNPAAESLLGSSLAEVRGQPWNRLLGMDMPAAGEGPPLADLGIPRRWDDATFHHKDGTPFQVAYVAAPLVREGEAQGSVLVFRDVTERRAQERRRREADQALVALAKDPALREGDLDEALSAITEVAARVLGVPRVSVWRLDAEHARIRCIHRHGEGDRDHGVGAELSAKDCPAYFAAIEMERAIAVHDACTDPRTRDFAEPYLVPLGIASTLDVPFRVEGRMEGIVCHEHQGVPRRWSYDEEAFAAAIADMVSLAFSTSHRRRTEEALRKERAQLQRVVEHASVILFSLDAGGAITLAMGKGLEALSLTPEWLVGRSAFDVYPRDRETNEHIRRALAGETFTSLDHVGGRVFETRWSALRDKDGARVGIVGVATDVTEQTRALQALEASEERFSDLVEAIDGIVWEGEVGSLHHTYVCCHTQDILGYAPARWTQEDDFWARHVHPDDRERVVSARRKGLTQRAPHVLEYRMVAADGREIWVRDLATFCHKEGRPEKVMGVMVDITGIKLAEAALAANRDGLRDRVEQRTRELRATNEELEAFTRAVSHDLRGHLRGIDALSEALLEDEGPRLGLESRRSLERLREESRRLGALVDSLLKFSLAVGGGLRRERVDVSALARETVRKLRERDPDREVEVDVEEDVRATGDPGLLSLVVENLVGNAWKYTSRTRGARIELRTREGPGGERVIMVRDNGAGFDMAEAGLLFRPFQRLHSQAEFGGTGIGLATVRRIVERHGGRVWAEGQKGRGATFSFAIPEKPRQAAAPTVDL